MDVMPNCDMCGSSERLFNAIIEGARLTVCEQCGKLGKILQPVRVAQPAKTKAGSVRRAETPVKMITVIVGDYAKRIRSAREKSGLSQQEFAAKLNERESVVQHLENGKSKPSVDVARKLERILSISLIENTPSEEADEDDEPPKNQGSSTLTLGDIIKIRKR